MQRFFLLLGLLSSMTGTTPAAETVAVADGINQFGLDLHTRLAAKGGNVVFPPWSIETALAMTYAGAGENTKLEMAKVLHLPADDAATHQGIPKISADLLLQAKQSQQRFKQLEKHSRQGSPLELQMAKRLFGQKGYSFESPFLKTLADTYGAPMQPLDFRSSPTKATKFINGWVSKISD